MAKNNLQSAINGIMNSTPATPIQQTPPPTETKPENLKDQEERKRLDELPKNKTKTISLRLSIEDYKALDKMFKEAGELSFSAGVKRMLLLHLRGLK